MRKLIIATMLAASSVPAFAMPTKADLKKAQPLVVELMAPAMEKYKSAPYKEKSAAAAKVGDASAEFAKAAETEAAKFLLLKGAVSFYARGEQYDKAAETVTTLQREIKDVPPAVIAEITGKATGRISETKAPALYALYRTAKLQVRASEEAKALAAKLKKAQSDALQRKYAEALAVSGDWKSAYAEFAKVKNAKLQAIVKDESSGSAKNAEAGEFWWTYEPAMEGAEDFFKSHAAAFYRKALEANEITGLKKNLIEQRIKDVKPEIAQNAVGEASSLPTTKSTTSAMVRQDAAPTSSGKAWQEKGNTAWLTLPNGEKLEFAKCPAGSVEIGIGIRNWTKYPKTKSVRITRPFWIMVSPLARRHFKGYPAYMAMFGNKDESPYNYCEGYYDDVMGFANTLTEEVKRSLPKDCVIRLPSFAEWEYSFRAGSRDPNDPYANFDISRRKENSARCRECFYFLGEWGKWDDDLRGKTKKNNWGLHDFWREKLLDRVDESNAIPTKEGWQFGRDQDNRSHIEALRADAIDQNDPLLWSDNDNALPLQRGQCDWGYLQGRHKWNYSRLVVGPDLVSEWRAKHAKK